MMGRQNNDQGHLFYEFRLDEAVPDDHLVRKIDAVLDLSWVHAELAPHYATRGRPSVDPVLMIRILIIGYVFGLRSERLLCREVQVNFAYRWFCKLGIEHKIPDHSAFSRARNERFRDSDIFRRVFERVVEACIAANLVGGEGFAVDASLSGSHPRQILLRQPDWPQYTPRPHAQIHGEKCRCRGSAHCGPARTLNDQGSCALYRACKTNDRRSSPVPRGTAIARNAGQRHNR